MDDETLLKYANYEYIAAAERMLSYKWRNRGLLVEALTHSSKGNASGVPHNERLEFLGDAVLDLICAEFLMSKLPDAREGVLSNTRATLVCAASLAAVARKLGVNSLLQVANRNEYLRDVESVMADTMEAIIGSIYLDSGCSLPVVGGCCLAWGIIR